MNFFKNKQKRKLFIIVTSILLSLTIITVACSIYLGDYYPADEDSVATFLPSENISVSTMKNGNIVFEPQGAVKGFIFYPGGKVDHHAYQQLMAELAREGILCVLVEMPFRLAVFDINAADGIQQAYPQIESWYIGGHSLGGSMAASYLKKKAESYDGLVLLGSYSTTDLSSTELDVISIYGSEDKVMKKAKYEANRSNLPNNLTEIVIEGGCHAYFGTYGAQDGDGTPAISNEEQIELTATYITEMIYN